MASPQASPDRTLAEAIAHHKAGKFEKALKGYSRVLKRNPTHLDALILGGQAAHFAGKRDTALRMLTRASRSYPDNPQASYNLGVLHKSNGSLEEALQAFKMAARAEPAFAPAHYNAGLTLFELGEAGEALEYLDRAIAAEPNHAEAWSSKAFILRGEDRKQEAIDAYTQSVRINPNDAKAWSGLGVTYQETGQLDEALAAHRKSLSLDPEYPFAVSNLADTLVQMGKAGEAVEACDAYLVRHPANAGVLASKSIALNEAGAADQVEALVGIERLIQVMPQDAPQGFADIETFNKALAKHVLHHPTLVTSPSSHATRKGKHTGEINAGEKGPVAAFEHLIHDAVETYMEAVKDEASHPVVGHRPARYKLAVWAVVLEGEGYQVPHIHPSAWLSGVYYARVPGEASAGGDDGWIEFGQPGPEYHFSAKPKLRLVKPEPGLMVMFPSYVFHRTVPFESDETRISIAFDVVPA